VGLLLQHLVALCMRVAAKADFCAAMKKANDSHAEPQAQQKCAWLLCFKSKMIL